MSGGPAFEAIVTAVGTEAEGVRSLVLARADGVRFPPWTPGAHIDLALANGLSRQYSLCGDPAEQNTLRIAVLREAASRGGSVQIHDAVEPGSTLTVTALRNNFPLVEADRYLLIAGGIGITPILAMVRQLEATGKDWRLLYGGRTLGSMAFLGELAAFGDKVRIVPQDSDGLPDIAGFLGTDEVGKAAYCCGPEPLIRAAESHCRDWPEDSLQIERFRPREAGTSQSDASFEVELRRSGMVVTIPADRTIAETLEEAGVYIPRSCNEGTCGTCITKVLEGIPDHRDSFLRPRQRAENKRIMPCCSRALTERLVLDA
jgi:ferredoxin-NADP reductase